MAGIHGRSAHQQRMLECYLGVHDTINSVRHGLNSVLLLFEEDRMQLICPFRLHLHLKHYVQEVGGRETFACLLSRCVQVFANCHNLLVGSS